MTLKNKIISTVLILCIVINLFAGCTDTKKAEIKDNTLTINLIASNSTQIIKALKTKFPDINFVVKAYAGANASGYQKQQLVRGNGGDIFFYTTFLNSNNVGKYLIDLSGYPFLANYDKSILSTLDVGGAVYQIPGPITVRYIAVNKTLFKERGWKIPENFEEMVTVCRQIHEEAPEIAPLGLGSLGMGFIWTLVTSYTQVGYLDTAEGQLAEQAYRQGTASFGEAFGEGLDMVGQLIDAGAFMPEKFKNTWDVTPEQMCNREAAMCYVMNPNERHTMLYSGQAKGDSSFGEHTDDEFVILPLFGKNAKNKGLILGASNTWGISKYLEKPGNENKLQNALRVLEYLSTEEGQSAISYDSSAIPAIKNIHSNDIPEFMRNLWNDSTNSIKSFFLYTGYEHMMIDSAQVILDAMYAGSSRGMKDKFIRVADQMQNEFIQNKSFSCAYGYVQDDLSVEQTRRISCEAFSSTAKADIAIASENGINNGVLNTDGLAGQLFKGDIIGESLNIIVGHKNANVVSLPLTGKEIREMLEKGKIVENPNGKDGRFKYWASGVDISQKDAKISEIKINGKVLDDNATYNVAMIDGDYPQELAANRKITDTGVVITDALGNYFKAMGTIKAES